MLIGAGVSVVVGLLFWPRGAGAELARGMGHAYATAATWLAASVDEVGRSGGGTGVTDGIRWSPERTASMDAARRLDDAYRQYLGERGAKPIPLSVVTRLLTGCARIRLTALTLDGLPDLVVPGGPPPLHEVVAARATVTAECAAVESWFDGFVVLDADSELSPNFLSVMNSRLCKGAQAMQGRYDVLNLHANWRTRFMS